MRAFGDFLSDYVSPRSCGPGIWQLTLPVGAYVKSVNAYLIEDEDGVTLVDSGVGNDATWEVVNRGLDELHIPLRHIDRILLTHAHPDHSGLADRLASATGATVWAHEEDLELINHRYVVAEQFWSDTRDWLIRQGTPAEEAAQLAGPPDVPPPQTPALVRNARRYGHDDRVQIGPYDFRVVWTPGHTPGHVCFTDEATATVLCGDHILPTVSPNIGLHPDTPLNPLPGYLRSLQEFAESSYQVALPGHGAANFDIQARARHLWDRQMERRERVLDLLTADGLTPYELAERVWADTKPLAWSDFRGHLRRNAIATLVAHLELLREEGKVERSGDTPYRYGTKDPDVPLPDRGRGLGEGQDVPSSVAGEG
jgi:glyoxylase-like metal-dependent hydrolase (beta-lactamase superfamily II)